MFTENLDIMKVTRLSVFICIIILALTTTAHARALKMIFWYPGEAGSTTEAQPIIDEFTKLLNAKLAPDTISGKYFNTVDGGLAFIKGEKPVIGIISYAAWIQNKEKLGNSSVILATLPLPHGKSTEQYELVGPVDKIADGAIIFSSEPLSLPFVRGTLFAEIPQDAKLTQSNQLLMKLKETGEGKLNAFAIITPTEAASLEKISAVWAKGLKVIIKSKPVSTARVVLFDSASKDADKIKTALMAIGSDPASKEVLDEMRLKGFSTDIK